MFFFGFFRATQKDRTVFMFLPSFPGVWHFYHEMFVLSLGQPSPFQHSSKSSVVLYEYCLVNRIYHFMDSDNPKYVGYYNP